MLMKRDPLNPGLGQGFNFSKAYLQKSSDDPIVPGEEKKQNNMKRKGKLAGTKMNS